MTFGIYDSPGFYGHLSEFDPPKLTPSATVDERIVTAHQSWRYPKTLHSVIPRLVMTTRRDYELTTGYGNV